MEEGIQDEASWGYLYEQIMGYGSNMIYFRG